MHCVVLNVLTDVRTICAIKIQDTVPKAAKTDVLAIDVMNTVVVQTVSPVPRQIHVFSARWGSMGASVTHVASTV